MHGPMYIKKQLRYRKADSGGRAVYGVGLRLVHCWDWTFEFHRGHGVSSLLFALCCEGSGL